MKHIIVKSSDLGDNWTAEHHIAKAEAAKPPMRLIHHSPEPFEFDPEYVYTHHEIAYSVGKPRGLWLSDEATDWGWRAWCEAESFRPDALDYETEFTLTPEANVLIITTEDEFKAFGAEWRREPDPDKPWHDYLTGIDWPKVAERYDGIIITPYRSESRFDFENFWYAGWDCASGCIWNLRAIAPKSDA